MAIFFLILANYFYKGFFQFPDEVSRTVSSECSEHSEVSIALSSRDIINMILITNLLHGFPPDRL